MGREDDSSPNIFVRFKHHIDASISSGVNAVLGSQASPDDVKNHKESSKSDHRNTSTTSSLELESAHPKHSKIMDLFNMDISWPDSSNNLSSIAFSHYSPLALRSLSQPVPNDAPPDDNRIFTFEDAFEDLLAVSKGQPLPDITTRYEQRKLLRSMFPNGEPAWFWVRRLRSQGLLDTPKRDMLFGFSSSLDWELFHRELGRKAAEVWRAATSDTEKGSFFGDFGHIFRRIDEGLSGRDDTIQNTGPEERQQKRREPDHFDDLFDSIQSTFAEGQKTWDTFIKAITQTSETSTKGPDEGNKPVTKDERVEKNQIVNKDEYVDRFGYLHSKVTTKTLDDDGNEIGSETRISIRPAEKSTDAAHHGETTKSIDDGKDDGKPGWFWK